MGYAERTVASFRKRPRFVRARRTASTLTLLVCFVVSTFSGLAPYHAAAAQAHEPSHEMTSSHDMAAHHMAAAHRDMADVDETTVARRVANHGRNHDCDCDCGKSLIASCCVQAASVAAIWTSLPASPKFRAARCASVRTGNSASQKINPPIPPPRTVLS